MAAKSGFPGSLFKENGILLFIILFLLLFYLNQASGRDVPALESDINPVE